MDESEAHILALGSKRSVEREWGGLGARAGGLLLGLVGRRGGDHVESEGAEVVVERGCEGGFG